MVCKTVACFRLFGLFVCSFIYLYIYFFFFGGGGAAGVREIVFYSYQRILPTPLPWSYVLKDPILVLFWFVCYVIVGYSYFSVVKEGKQIPMLFNNINVDNVVQLKFTYHAVLVPLISSKKQYFCILRCTCKH